MIPRTTEAIRISQRYSAGACEWSKEKIENTMFDKYYLAIAEFLGAKEIGGIIATTYWIGNSVITSKLKPNKFDVIPFHNSVVLSLAKKESIEEANNCLVLSGVVKDVSKGFITIVYKPLIFSRNRFCFGRAVAKRIKKNFLKVKVGDIVSFHRGVIAERLSKNEADFLLKMTKKIINRKNKKDKK